MATRKQANEATALAQAVKWAEIVSERDRIVNSNRHLKELLEKYIKDNSPKVYDVLLQGVDTDPGFESHKEEFLTESKSSATSKSSTSSFVKAE